MRILRVAGILRTLHLAEARHWPSRIPEAAKTRPGGRKEDANTITPFCAAWNQVTQADEQHPADKGEET
jgi:hypothetical protein